MNNIKNIYTYEVGAISHSSPVSWGKGDITSSNLSNDLESLLQYLSGDNLKKEDAIELRKASLEFNNLYFALHRELEEKTGVVFFPDTIFKYMSHKKRRDVFYLLGEFIGMPVPINKIGTLIREVRDTGKKDSIKAPVRGHLTDQKLDFHSDRADLTMLLCESLPESGGEFKICSSVKLHSVLNEYPKELAILTSAVPHDLRNEGIGHEHICYHPIISTQMPLVVRYIRKFVNSTVRHGVKLGPDIINALNKVDEIINSDGFYEEFNFCPGDLIIMNNHITLHARNKFIDSVEQQRCLLRVWLSSEFSRELPESFQPIFHSTSAGSFRGGIR